MATIKSYTDISQSKKLAKFLSPESADMCWNIDFTNYPSIEENIGFYQESKADIPCWSLAALLGVLPNNKYITTTLSRGGWKIEPPEYIDKWWCEYENENDHTGDITVKADNPIDACYEMILKLHELNLL